MIEFLSSLNPQHRETLRTIVAFLDKRLAEQGTIDWALQLKPNQHIERIAVRYILASQGTPALSEPWLTAWRLIEESWSLSQSARRDGIAIYDIQKRLAAGDRSGALVAAIVDLVAPRLKVEPVNEWQRNFIKKPRRPKMITSLLSSGLTSGDLIDLSVVDLAKITETDFLIYLANALESAVINGLDIARRLGWDGKKQLWRLGDLRRVYYTTKTPRAHIGGDPDALHRGIAPSVKLLHAVIARIAELDPATAKSCTGRWRQGGTPVHIRLWAAMSRNTQITSADELSSFFITVDQDKFWDLHSFPEIVELRAVRFRDLSAEAQAVIVDRLQKGPPRDRWPKKADAEDVDNARLYWSLRELRRIEAGGGILPKLAKAWLDAKAVQFDELTEIAIDTDFLDGVSVRHREVEPDTRFDTLAGVDRLKALEAALGTGCLEWDDDPAERARSWINNEGNLEKLLSDFEATNNGGNDFPEIWDRFCWEHRPLQQSVAAARDAKSEEDSGRVLGFLNQLSDATLSNAISGISAWLSTWQKHVVKLPLALTFWLRLWPIAVNFTNKKHDSEEDEDLSVVAPSQEDDRLSKEIDTLNTPAGRLVGVFLAACPNLSPERRAFSANSPERKMRDSIIASKGRSELIAKHRMIEALPYFMHADEAWAREHLIAPLLRDDDAALALWQAVARRTHFTDVLKCIGVAMAERANDRRLSRDTRRRLVFSLVIETLHSFREGRAPSVPNQRITQMLRTLDDEVRASAASTVEQFVRELSAKAATNGPNDGEERENAATAAVLFRSSAAPFLREVWPQERSLVTPGVSSALADLPATAGEAFAEAVDTIARFLVPFECWSMIDYGLYGGEGESKKLTIIDDEAKARALLKMLDLTVGTSEGSAVPHDLTDALDQMTAVAPILSRYPEFRRLSTQARR